MSTLSVVPSAPGLPLGYDPNTGTVPATSAGVAPPAPASKSLTPVSILMLDPDGNTVHIPADHVPDALKDGGKIGVRMIAPDGSPHVIPFDNQDAAQRDGGKWDVSPDNDAVKRYVSAHGWRAPEMMAGPNGQMFDMSQVSNPEGPQVSTPLDSALAGFGKAGASSVRGVQSLAEHALPSADRALTPQVKAQEAAANTPHGAGEWTGAVAENAGEFILGGEILDGLAETPNLIRVAKVMKAATGETPDVSRVLTFMESHPKIVQTVTSVAKNAVIGGTQGAVKGAATPLQNPFRTAVGGAVGGALGGAVGELAGPATDKLGESMGIGLDPIDALQKALRPAGREALNFADRAEAALPRLIEANKTTPITDLDELSDAAHSAANNLWTNEIKPQIAKYGTEKLSGKPIADAIRNGISAGSENLFPDEADAVNEFAQKFEGNLTVQQAADNLQELNNRVSSLYKMDPAARYHALAGKPNLAAMEDAANSLRQELYSKLESLGEKDPAGLRKQYGALKTIESLADKRSIVYGRQNPINLTQILSAAAGTGEAASALFSGHPMAALAGAVPIIVTSLAKKLNAPESLIQSALEDGIESSGLRGALSAAGSKVGAATKATLPIAGSQVGQGIAGAENSEQ